MANPKKSKDVSKSLNKKIASIVLLTISLNTAENLNNYNNATN